MHTSPPHYGHGVSGERFWPRERLCAEVLTALRHGECVKLFGPRRTGKSSLLKESARRLRTEGGFLVVETRLDAGLGVVADDLADLIHALEEDGFLTDDRDLDQIGFASRLVEGWRTRDQRRGRRPRRIADGG